MATNEPPAATIIDPDGREVVRLTRIWEDKIARDDPELVDHLEAVIETVAKPDHIEADALPGRTRFYRRGAGPSRWLMAVVSYAQQPARIVTATGQPEGPKAMEAVNIRIGPLAFDHADYDAEGDVLYLHVGQPQPGEGEETPEGHVLRFAPGTQQIVGLTVINARQVLNRDGRLIVTIPETVEASADDLAPALAAA